MKAKFRVSPHLVVSYAFYLTVAALPFVYYRPLELSSRPVLLWHLLRGDPYAYVIPASELEAVKPWLPKSGTVSLILDQPFGKEPKTTRFAHDAENYLCPLVIDKKPGERTAIVFCTSAEKAEERLRETGYRWDKKISDSKGTAVRIS